MKTLFVILTVLGLTVLSSCTCKELKVELERTKTELKESKTENRKLEARLSSQHDELERCKNGTVVDLQRKNDKLEKEKKRLLSMYQDCLKTCP